MNENLILVVDFEKICRLCLHATGAMSDLFENSGENKLKELVFRATGLEVENHYGFPTKICHRCRYIVELNDELRDMVARNNDLLVNANNSLEDISVQNDEIIDTPTPLPEKEALKKSVLKEKPDLRLVMQDDGVMTLMKPDPGTPVDEKPAEFDFNQDVGMKNDGEGISLPSNPKKWPKHLKCQICLVGFLNADEVNAHVEVHYVNTNLTPYVQLQRPYKCEACNKTVTKAQLVRHHRSHLNINPFVCKHAGCGFEGKNQDALRHHVFSHGARSQVCAACGAGFRRRSELRLHELRHTPAPAHCALCNKTFRNQITYKTHMLHYHKPRRHKCEWAGCGKAYHSPCELSAHARTHRAERRYRCALCQTAAYTSQSMLNRHLRMHKRTRLSKCDKCSMTFYDYGAFYKHRISEHGPWMPHKCVGCNKRYNNEANLEEHLEKCEQAISMSSLDEAGRTGDQSEPLLVPFIQTCKT